MDHTVLLLLLEQTRIVSGNLFHLQIPYGRYFNAQFVGTQNRFLLLSTSFLEPDGAPQNVNGYNTSSTSIRVSWEEVPVVRRNGIITKYTITYRSLTKNHNGNVTVTGNPPALTGEITGLRKYVEYNITVFASTVKGDGPYSTTIIVRTAQDSK